MSKKHGRAEVRRDKRLTFEAHGIGYIMSSMKKQPFDFRKFFLLLGLMGAALLITVLAMGIMASLYIWFGPWGVAAFLLVLFVASRMLVRRYVPRLLLRESEADESAVEDQES